MLKKILKWIGIILGSLVGLLLLASAVLYVIGSSKINKQYAVPVKAIAVPADTQSIERGKHLASTIFMCTRCHMDDLSGEVYFDVPGMSASQRRTSPADQAALGHHSATKTGCAQSVTAYDLMEKPFSL